jgi:hypothetical protein
MSFNSSIYFIKDSTIPAHPAIARIVMTGIAMCGTAT